MEESPKIKLFPVGISQLTSLHTLKGVEIEVSVDSEGRSINEGNADALKLQDLKELKLLQHLSLNVKIRSVDHARSFIQLQEGIFGGMTKMRTLILINHEQSKFLRLPEDMKRMQGLETVRLDRCETPKSISELKSIMRLDLRGDRCCRSSQCKLLARIPQLKTLSLWNYGKRSDFPDLSGESEAFPKLLSFEVVSFEDLQKFPRLDEGAMPRLKKLEFLWCDNVLTDRPSGIEKLTSLQELTVNIQLPRRDKKSIKKPDWVPLKQCKVKVRFFRKLDI